jgi:hypothetical protein
MRMGRKQAAENITINPTGAEIVTRKTIAMFETK